MNETLYTLASALISSSFFKKDPPKPSYFMPSCYFPSDPIQRKCGRNNHIATKNMCFPFPSTELSLGNDPAFSLIMS